MIKLMSPVGYCYGVKNSIASVIQTRKKHPDAKIFFLKPLVHNASTNKEVLKNLEAKVYDPLLPIQEYKDSFFALPAHGYTIKDLRLVKSLQASYIDCTCPMLIVNKNAMKSNLKSGFTVFLLGKKGHPEVLSILSSIPQIKFISIEEIPTYDYSQFEKMPKLAIYPQSTIGYQDYQAFLNKLQSHIKGKFIKGEICRECLKRWDSLKKLSLINNSTVIIVGDKDSSNANEFLKVAKDNFYDSLSFLAETKEDLMPYLGKINFYRDVYIFSSTSASPTSVNAIYKFMKKKLLRFIILHPFSYRRMQKKIVNNKSEPNQ